MEKASLKLLFVFVLVFSATYFPEGAEALGYCSSDSDCPSRCPEGCTDAHCQYVAEESNFHVKNFFRRLINEFGNIYIYI
ncbi:hypothetical protein NC653_026261 [Populus alba x Populus x berolinensis]|uniref:Uncharacterized protein n=1 Tax=Populus alba x Populus x berolinensis TaxID=444605 RepID=A0AAD6ME27_9ROSI|nr:hypothetical protein NC653_026261 [Populus alba x Populus x berolinensis]